MESTRQVNATVTKTTAQFGWMGITGNNKQQQWEAFGTLYQNMKLRWALGNLKLSLKLLTTLDNSMEVTETQYVILYTEYKRTVCSPEDTASIAFRASSKVDVEAEHTLPIEKSCRLNLMLLVEDDFEQKQEEEQEHSLEVR